MRERVRAFVFGGAVLLAGCGSPHVGDAAARPVPELVPRVDARTSVARRAAPNPIVPHGVYVADPSARVASDGRLVVIGTRDLVPTAYCSNEYPLLTTRDLSTWELTERVFASSGDVDRVPGSDALLYAPDLVERAGRWYLYYCLAGGERVEGVAVGASASGPFEDGAPLDVFGHEQIDPAVFLDDDGAAYYVWGQFDAKIARLAPDMRSLDAETLRTHVLTEEEHFFHEGAFLAKRAGRYYLVYAHMGRAERPTCIGWAVSDDPLGPYEYGGVIVDNDRCDPAVWNNHGSIVEFDGQWYVLYHRSTHGSRTMRKACIEPIAFDEFGRIGEVEMTTQGAGGPLDARERLDAARACLLEGRVRVELVEPGREALTQVASGDRAAFKYLDFERGERPVERVHLRVRAGAEAAQIDVAFDRAWNRRAARVEVPAAANADADAWLELSAPIEGASGVRAVWLRARGGAGDLVIDALWFE
jgi:arabinoxylan arabinofuranohydrolase